MDELPTNPGINRNADLNLSAYLMYCGFEFLGITMPANNTGRFAGKMTFDFPYTLEMKEKKEEYFSGSALVEPKVFCKHRQFLRKRIQEMQAVNHEG